jgi:hypothetical protein
VKNVIIHITQKIDAVAGIITTVRIVDKETGEILRSDIMARQWGDPVEIKKQMLNDAIKDCEEKEEKYEIYEKESDGNEI